MTQMNELRYLKGYPSDVLAQVDTLIKNGRLAEWVTRKYPEMHNIKTERALYEFTLTLKNQFMKKSSPLSKVIYDPKIHLVNHALGLHTFVSRPHGKNLKAKNEIRISSLFRTAPEPLLRMLVVHELAHLREKEHNKAFYALCCHMEPDYHQLEFDARLYLTHKEIQASTGIMPEHA